MSRINNQIQHRISAITVLGEKKKEAQKNAREIYLEVNGNLKGYNQSKTFTIRSINTAITYRKAGKTLALWLKDEKKINKINKVTRELATEYLKYRQNKDLSAWTIKRDLAAINKIFGYNITSKELNLKQRKIVDIKRSRKGPDLNRPGLDVKYKEHITFIKACGCRRSSITNVKYEDIVFKDGIAIEVNLIEKGGKFRIAPVLKSYQKEFTELVNGLGHDKNMFKSFDNHVAAHYYRHLYTKELYKELLSEIGSDEHEKYKGYDKEVLKLVSKALGHNRVNVVVDNYMY